MNREITHQQSKKFIGLDIYLCKHCNLNCKGCSRYCGLSKPTFYDSEKLINDLTILKNKGLNVGRLTFTGGEPLLHPDLYNIIKKTRLLFPDIPLNIFTNAKIFLKKRGLIEVLKENRIEVLYSRYVESDINYDKVEEVCKDNNILIYNIQTFDSKRKDKYIKTFSISRLSYDKYNLHKSQKDALDVMKKYLNICNDTCPCLWNGKIFLCGRCAFIETLNNLGEHFNVSKKDYLDINNINNINDYLKFISKPIPFCKYCFNRDAEHIEWTTDKSTLKDYVC